MPVHLFSVVNTKYQRVSNTSEAYNTPNYHRILRNHPSVAYPAIPDLDLVSVRRGNHMLIQSVPLHLQRSRYDMRTQKTRRSEPHPAPGDSDPAERVQVQP